jgi:hypothetical protein
MNTVLKWGGSAVLAYIGYRYYKFKQSTDKKVTVSKSTTPVDNIIATTDDIRREVQGLLKRYPNPNVNPSISEETAVYNYTKPPQISQNALDQVSSVNADGSLRFNTQEVPTDDGTGFITLY